MPTLKSLKRTKNLEIETQCNHNGQTIVTHQYTAYPLGISRTFRQDPTNSNRAYLYITSISPGVLANDQLQISLKLGANTELHLTEQSATKVHPMPRAGSKATIDYEIEIGEKAALEFVPEPIILFKDAILEQKTSIKCHPSGQLFWSEIIVPGRLARGECYDFNYYFNRLEVRSSDGELWFTDAMRLEGKFNSFKDSHLFASSPILGNLIIIVPQTNLQLLSDNLEKLEAANCFDVKVASSILPQSKGLLIRTIANRVGELKNYLEYALNYVHHLNHQPVLSSLFYD